MLCTLAVVLLAISSSAQVSARVLPTSHSLSPRVISTVGPASVLSPNSQTLVAQCEPLSVSFTTAGPPKNLTLWIAVNNLAVPGAFWNWPSPPNNGWNGTSTIFSEQWPAVDVSGGSVMWAELQGWEGDSSYLLGDGITVQASTTTSCLAQDYGSLNYVGDSVHVVLGETLRAVVTTIIGGIASSTAVSSFSPTTTTSSSTTTANGAFVSSSPTPISTSVPLSFVPSSTATSLTSASGPPPSNRPTPEPSLEESVLQL